MVIVAAAIGGNVVVVIVEVWQEFFFFSSSWMELLLQCWLLFFLLDVVVVAVVKFLVSGHLGERLVELVADGLELLLLVNQLIWKSYGKEMCGFLFKGAFS